MSDYRDSCTVDVTGSIHDELVEAPGDSSKYVVQLYVAPDPGGDGAVLFKVSGPKAWFEYPGMPGNIFFPPERIRVVGNCYLTQNGTQRIDATLIEYVGMYE